jgi:hypothetical protein
MLRVVEEFSYVQGFGCVYRVTRHTWRLFGIPVWASQVTERLP